MGVIHKLKDEVVSFIIAQKKSDPRAGVRQLAALTSEKFQIKVSKSSVNEVLKRSSLSSSVGRRAAGTARPEKFAIPVARKKEISKNMRKLGMARKDAPEESAPVARADEPAAVEVRQDRDFFRRVEHLRSQRKSQKAPASRGMGFVFLKAAQWEISSRSWTAALLRKYITAPVSGHFDAAVDMFLFLKFLGAETFEDAAAYEDHGLWLLNGFGRHDPDGNRDLSGLRELFGWDKTMRDPAAAARLVMEYGREKEQAFLDADGFRLLLEDGSELTMDASMSSFAAGPAPSQPAGRPLPVDKAMTWLSNCLISNIRSPVFQKIPGEDRFDQSFYDMAAVFENFPGKRILKTSVFSGKDGEIAAFSTVPRQKRTFLAGVDPRQGEFKELTKTVKWAGKRPFYHEETDTAVYFTETKTDFITAQLAQLKGKTGVFRVITVWQEKEADPFWAVLTNQGRGSGGEILGEYMSRWPYFGLPARNVSVLSCDISETKRREMPVTDIFRDFIESLHGYCRRHFFPQACSSMNVTELIPILYDLPGNFHETKERVAVSLEIPDSAVHRKDIEYAVRRVNESHVFDYAGRRLWLDVDNDVYV